VAKTFMVNNSPSREQTASRLLHLYKRMVSPSMRSSCRFSPTCSEYAAEAIARRGWFIGSLLAVARVARCHPFSRGGFDPVPEHHSHFLNSVR
jgi:putative membrane protein insertion efficiency factor